MTKYAVVTTFPNKEWYEYLNVSTLSWCQHLPKDITLLIKLYKDDHLEVVEKSLENFLKDVAVNRTVHIETGSTKDENDFYERHKNYDNKGDYRLNYKGFSYKVFAIWQAYLFCKQSQIDYLIWLDADILCKENILEEDLEQWIGGADIAYLGRKDWDHSECGFVAFKVDAVGEFLEKFHEMYVKDDVLNLQQHHDSYVFDHLRSVFPELKCKNISEGIEGRDVFNISPLGAKLHHYKGPIEKKNLMKKVKALRGEDVKDVIDVNDIKIKTKNCVDKDKIRHNISQNVRLIRNWYQPCKKTEETIIICSGGPSLDPIVVKKYYDEGYKIIAVKHAVKPLRSVGIIPFAVILLDPRAHVSDFVDDIPLETLVFVASMVDPLVTEKLLERNYKVIGYHAAVGADEQDYLRNGDCIILGGSATATRGISLLEGLGFKNMELFGYDCCYHEKPNLQEKRDNGTFKYEEVTLEVETYGTHKLKRTFWTEGQLLAQLQEFRNYYFIRDTLNLTIHGDGMIPWIWRNKRYHKKFLDEKDSADNQKALELKDYLGRIHV